MTMLVLLVEDEAEFVDAVREVLHELSRDIRVQVAQSRSSALELIASQFFDLIVLDLKIPTIDGALDADPTHGHLVFARARADVPGTPIFVLTGSPAEDFIQPMLAQQQQVDIWGQNKRVGTVSFLKKLKFDEFSTSIGEYAAAVDSLTEIELDGGGTDIPLHDSRLLRIFAKRVKGVRCVVSLLGGGLSNARVYRVKTTNAAGAMIHDAIAKIGHHAEVRAEGVRFDGPVARLNPAATPRKIATLQHGAGSAAANFYGLADGGESAFDIARVAGERSSEAIRSAESATGKWIEGVGETRRTIKDVRRRLLSDEVAHDITTRFEIGWGPEFETRAIQTRWCCIHGDLHGSNVLVSSTNQSVLIDYGDVGDGPASLDPVTLELSLLFHPQGLTGAAWPSLDVAVQWGDLEAYLVGCPSPGFVRECRAWAVRAGAGKREIAAAAYSYLIRQLKYADTNKPLALALLQGVKTYYDAT